MKRILYLIIFLLAAYGPLSAQRNVPPELERRLAGKTRVVDIMNEVSRYYDFGRANIARDEEEEDDFEGNDYEWWKKWEYWAIRRLNPDGTLADHRSMNYQARQQVEARFGSQLREAATALRNANIGVDRDVNPQARGNMANRSYGGWTTIGPTTGGNVVGSGTNIDINGLARMNRIAFHPTDPNIFYVGSPSGGLFKTTNGGGSWTSISDGLPGGIACIAVSPANGNIIYVFSGDGDSHYSGTLVFGYSVSPISRGIFKSTDAGATWTKMTDMYIGVGDIAGHQLAIAQNNSNFLFASTDRGVYRTTDGGNSWEQVRNGNYYDVEFRPHDDSTVYTTTSNIVEYSTGGGRTGTWNTSTFDFPPTATRIDIAVRKNNTGTVSTAVYALAGSVPASGTFRGLYMSLSSGVSFTRQSNSPNILGSSTTGAGTGQQARYDQGVCIKPTDFNYVVTAGMCVWHSDGSNGGTTMVFGTTYREGLGPASAYIHPDVHDVQYNPINNYLYACSDGGVFRSIDDGVTWTNLSTGLIGTQFYRAGMKDVDGDGEMEGLEMIGGAQDNGIKYRTSGGGWRHIICCDGYGGVIKGEDNDYLVMTFNDAAYRTPDGGVTMTPLTDPAFFSPMAIDHDNDDTMYMASSSLRRSFDGFQTFSTLAFDLNNFITTCPSNNARLYGSSSSKTNLRISEDRGSSWTTISGNTGWPAGSPVITDCKPWLTSSSEIYATFGGYTAGLKVYRSLDAGVNWSNYSGSLPNVPIHSCAVAGEGVYVGTEIGVFFRPDGAADWTPFYTGMPNVIVSDLWVNENGFVYASTFGRGAWIADRYSVCDAVVNVSGNLSGPQYFEASTTANVTATSQAGAGTDIFVKSNGYVDLLDGFEIKDGTFFEAFLGPCSSGGIPVPRTDGVNRSIIEYDDKARNARMLQPGAYYTLVRDGIEVNVPQKAVLDIEVVNTKTNEVKKLVTRANLSTGMYKILTGAGMYAVKVRLNGGALQKR